MCVFLIVWLWEYYLQKVVRVHCSPLYSQRPSLRPYEWLCVEESRERILWKWGDLGHKGSLCWSSQRRGTKTAMELRRESNLYKYGSESLFINWARSRWRRQIDEPHYHLWCYLFSTFIYNLHAFYYYFVNYSVVVHVCHRTLCGITAWSSLQVRRVYNCYQSGSL